MPVVPAREPRIHEAIAVTLFLLLFDSTWFHQTMQPALSRAWRARSFAPCQALCVSLTPGARAFIERYGRAEEEPLLSQVAEGLVFQRELWPLLVGEVLLYGAAELASVDADPDTLCLLLTGAPWSDALPREQFAPIHQVLWGTRELAFGGKYYRPHHAGVNNLDDVRRLRDYLAGIEPTAWTAARLSWVEPEERAEELAFARQSLEELRQLYERARAANYVLVREVL